MTIPEIREAMKALAGELAAGGHAGFAGRLLTLAEETKRRSPLKRARASAKHVTPEVKEHVRQTARANPDWSNRRIGQHCRVDGGRVSEILRGFRT